VLRLALLGQSLFADELSTWWIVSSNGLGGVVSTVHTDAEITPPLSFALSWLATRIHLSPEWLRLPSLVAGVAIVPFTYLLGLRTVGRWAGVLAAGLVTVSPFMLFYSVEARGYALMVALVLVSTLAMLEAARDGRRRWWVLYALATCAAVYSHYIVVFALGAQLAWLLWAHSEARQPALLANGAAALGFLPWVTGLSADFGSPTTRILSQLQPFKVDAITTSLGHWAVGYPTIFVFPHTQLRELPGRAALAALALGVAIGAAGAAAHWLRRRPCPAPPVVLVVLLALATPVGEALVSAVGTNLFGTRNLAVAWPPAAVVLAGVLLAAGPRLRIAAVALVVAGFSVGAAKMLEDRFARPDYEAAAAYVDRGARRDDVVVDGSVAFATPGPVTGLDVSLRRPHRILRAGGPQERDDPFSAADPVLPAPRVMRLAAAAARGHRLFVVASHPIARALPPPPAPFHEVDRRDYPGLLDLSVRVYEDGRG